MGAAAAPLAGAAAVIAVFVLPYLFVPDALHALLFNMVELSGRYSTCQASLVIRLMLLLLRFDLADIFVVDVALVLHGVILRRGWGAWSREERMENVVLLVILGHGWLCLAVTLAVKPRATISLLSCRCWHSTLGESLQQSI
ncbi:MAG: hypothetical protein ACXVCT_05420 [Ktedonobacterales bacterium]